MQDNFTMYTHRVIFSLAGLILPRVLHFAGSRRFLFYFMALFPAN
jgi:hypothetical protein